MAAVKPTEEVVEWAAAVVVVTVMAAVVMAGVVMALLLAKQLRLHHPLLGPTHPEPWRVHRRAWYSKDGASVPQPLYLAP